MKLILLFPLFCIFSLVVFAQDAPIIFDRPGISDSPYIVDSNRYQFETGISLASVGNITDGLNPNIMFRKYLGKQTELRCTYNYMPLMMGMVFQIADGRNTPLAIGVKHKLLKEDKWIPEASFIVNTFYPIQKLGSLAKNNVFNVDAGFQFQSHINDYLAINYNVGGIFTNTYKNGILTYSLSFNGLVAKNLELFIEAYGFNANHSSPETGLDGGAIWYPNDWSQIDISLAVNRYQHANFSTILIGYSFAVDRKK